LANDESTPESRLTAQRATKADLGKPKIQSTMTLKPRLLLAALTLSAAGLVQAQTGLLNVSYDVSREFYKD
jgi:ABC-type sulfate transport system substrate-binding protein